MSSNQKFDKIFELYSTNTSGNVNQPLATALRKPMNRQRTYTNRVVLQKPKIFAVFVKRNKKMLGYTARTKHKFHKKKAASFIEDAEHFRYVLKSETRRTTYVMNVYIYLLVWVKLGTIIFFIAMTFRDRFQGLMVKTPESGYQAKRYTVKVDNVHIWIDRRGNIIVDDFRIKNHLQRAEFFEKIVQNKQFNRVIFNVDYDAKMDDVFNMLSILTASLKKDGLEKEILFATQAARIRNL